ncbi:hypothetical protein [Carboxylicivirga sp. RSCT41]|uniref:hypothetical protein n=1 Tax=Carboxylicivirga agarovorans TaxID=3417570 RepID=UPI003D355F60
MKQQAEDITELVKQHIQSIDEAAELILLFPQGKRHEEAIQIYVLTSGKVTFETEQAYFRARYQLELASSYNFSIYIYAKDKWHQQLKGTPIYQKVISEGILL